MDYSFRFIDDDQSADRPTSAVYKRAQRFVFTQFLTRYKLSLGQTIVQYYEYTPVIHDHIIYIT
jgi:hypothetical protein